MRTGRAITILAGLVLTAVTATACGEEGQSGTEAPDPAAEGQGCAPVAGQQLVMLEDDQGLQLAENIVAAVNQDAATPELVAALDAVSATLDMPALVELKRAVDIDRQTAPAAAAAFATSSGLADGIGGGGSGRIVVGTADFSESQILAELYQIALEAAGFEVDVQTVGNRELYEPALERGEVQVMPEYLGTLTEFLNAKVNGADPELLASNDPAATLTALRDLGEQVGLAFGEPAEAATQNGFAVTQEFATEHGVSTLSQLAENCAGAQTILGGPPECPQRPFCQAGLEDVYGLSFGPFSSLDAGGPLTKEALRTGQISVGLVFTSDVDLAPA
ncbi:MAG: glycine/betaine ABC transporter substrate-binding protein [Micromonosporaceae bacterium]|nr:glycine/betaine ABC transporter substrate-binding protein [Micromonosporaceae bacterium]